MKTDTPKQFGKRPILMMRHDGGMRIISTSGHVEWAPVWHSEINGEGCTSCDSQREAYNACLEHDDINFEGINFSAFLGYL